MLIDDVQITVKAGNGGNGAATFRHNEGKDRGGPDGGNGGNGGDVYIQGTSDMTALQQFQYKKSLQADDGVSGKRKNLFGKNAEPLTILVPVGTLVQDLDSGRKFEIIDTDDKYLIAKGGKGGFGNNEFKSATNQAPAYAENGEKGEEKHLKLILRFIADIGLIGLPNAGKSSLLAALTNAQPKIANYPFTTLEPNLGVMGKIVLADIPGLIEGASLGKGLGIKFLKHIEKTRILIHCIDSTSDDVLRDYKTIRQELEGYAGDLREKKEIVLLTKSDLTEEKEVVKKKKLLQKHTSSEISVVSVIDDESLNELRQRVQSLLQE